jgi:hypothetical protein
MPVVGSLPQNRPPWRVPRAHLDGKIPAVLRLADGQRTWAKLQVVSLTGGLLSLSQPVVRGTQVKVMFLTGTGSVLGGVEMLPPVANALQPFRFVSIAADDHLRLKTLIWEQSNLNKSEQDWIEKLRAASTSRNEPQPWRLRLAAVIGLITVGLAAAAYLVHLNLLK